MRITLRVSLLVTVILALGVLAVQRISAPPKVEPPFERIVGDSAGPIKDFNFTDTRGAVHSKAEWAGRPAIVLFFLASKCPVTNAVGPELARLAGDFGPRGVLFLGIFAGPEETNEKAADCAARTGLTFPILVDPSGTLVRQAGARVTPEAVVLGADGQVYYRGNAADPDRRESPRDGQRSSFLKSALEALIAGDLPAVASTELLGTPLPPLTEANGDAGERITFNKHVAPILWNYCLRCHRHGDVGPFSLLTYQDAAKRASFIYELAAEGRMPPWKPRAGAGVFLDAPRLSRKEIEVLRLWAETGCDRGDTALLPAPPQFNDGWQLGRPDVVLTMREAFVVPAGGPDVYHSFCLPFPLDHDVTIDGVEFRPGNRRVTHHSRIYLDESGHARRRDHAANDSADLPYPGLGAWTPGMTPRFAPDGVGRVIRRGSDVVLQIHYHPTGKTERDQSRIGLYFAKKPITKSMAGYTLCTDRIDIPPGERRHKIILSTRIKADIHLYAIVPHAHYLCREFRLAATLPDGTIEPLLWIDDWDMDWQDQYRYARPVALPRGTILTLAAYFDNSGDNPRNPHKPPRRVRYGIETKDEMCACHLEFLVDNPSDVEVYPRKSPFGL